MFHASGLPGFEISDMAPGNAQHALRRAGVPRMLGDKKEGRGV